MIPYEREKIKCLKGRKNMATTAERIKQLRKKKGISQSELAEVIGVKNNTVSTWERGTRKPDFEALNLLSDYFEVSFEYILGSSDKEEARVKPTQDELDQLALSALADDLYDNMKKYCQLSTKSQKMIDALINATYQMEKQDGELKGDTFRVTIVPKEDSYSW